jgi:alpha-mannosidase
LQVSGARSARVVEAGPLRASLEFEYALTPASTLTQTVSLTALSPRLDFDTRVDWHEKRKFLKVEFPLNVRAANATYEIQFGHVQRPTHFNTTWDLARFEVCAHRWADLSEPGGGVALLNDCKYGHAAHGNVLRLSLLRAPTHPDPHADEGEHHFRYALLPHGGDFRRAGVVAEALRFNAPMLLSTTEAAPAERSFFNMDTPSVVIDTVKKAEDSDAVILRLYEAHGARGLARLSSSLPVKSAWRCNLLEEEDEPLAWEDGGVTLNLTPFQIVTVKLESASNPLLHPLD